MKGHPVNLNGFPQNIAGRSRDLGYDGRLVTRQSVQKAGFADIGPTANDNVHPASEQTTLPRGLGDGFERGLLEAYREQSCSITE